MHGLPASDPAPFLEARDLPCFGHVIWPIYTLSSNKHDSTNPSSDPSPLSPVSVFHSITSKRFSFGSSSLWQGGSYVRHWETIHLLQPLSLSGSFFFPYPQLLLNAVRFREERSLHSLQIGFTRTYKDVDFIHSSLPHFTCPWVHVLGWSLGPGKFHSAFKDVMWSFSSFRWSMCQRKSFF